MFKLLSLPLLVSVLVLPPSAQEKAPPRILIAYHSDQGHTRALAEAVAEGARSVAGVEVKLAGVKEATNDDVLAADAIILGSPVYNANPAPQVLEFVNGWPFRGSPLKDKIGAAFATAGGISAGEEAVQLSLQRAFLMFGMIVVGGSGWRSAFGASAVVNEDPFAKKDGGAELAPQFLEKGRDLGKRVATLALRWKGAPK
jgi:NAD(P)H dehydrogenase (quinone)